jgi:hypothetical protein
MKFNNINGNPTFLKNSKKYLINWEADSRSKFQTSVKNFLKLYWKGDQVFEEMRVVGTALSLDFYNSSKKVAVEVQGLQHTQYVKFFHRNKLQYLKQLKRDDKKLKFCEINSIILIEIYPKDVVNRELFLNFGVEL